MPAQSGSQFFRPGGDFAWYRFANVEGRYMAHNILLDGNTFEGSHSVDRREWVADAKVGVALTWSRWQLAFAKVWRTREFQRQREHSSARPDCLPRSEAPPAAAFQLREMPCLRSLR